MSNYTRVSLERLQNLTNGTAFQNNNVELNPSDVITFCFANCSSLPLSNCREFNVGVIGRGVGLFKAELSFAKYRIVQSLCSLYSDAMFRILAVFVLKDYLFERFVLKLQIVF